MKNWNQATTITIPPLPSHVLNCIWTIPGSKVITNRALVLAALADGTSVLRGALVSDDTAVVQGMLAELGTEFIRKADGTLFVLGGRSRLRPPHQPIDVGSSTSALRFGVSVACLVPGTVSFRADGLAFRSITDLIEPLQQLGVEVDFSGPDALLSVTGSGRILGGKVPVPVRRSSQFLSSLLLIGSLADSDVEIDIDSQLVGASYVALTCTAMTAFGATVSRDSHRILVRGKSEYSATDYHIEPDACSASYAFALAAATNSTIRVPGLGSACIQAESGFREILSDAGARVSVDEESTTVQGVGSLCGVDINMTNMPETVATLAALAPLSTDATRIRNIGELRLKAFDRLEALGSILSQLGQIVKIENDGIIIKPAPLRSATIRTRGDHQFCMSFAILGAARGGLTLDCPKCITKSYPNFWHDLASLYQLLGTSMDLDS